MVKIARDRRRELIALASKRLFESIDYDEVNDGGGEGVDDRANPVRETPFRDAPSVVVGGQKVGASNTLRRVMNDAAVDVATSHADRKAITTSLGEKMRGDITEGIRATGRDNDCTACAPGACLQSRPSTPLLGALDGTVDVGEGDNGSIQEQPHPNEFKPTNDGIIGINDGSTSFEGLSSTEEARTPYLESVLQASTEAFAGAHFAVSRMQSGVCAAGGPAVAVPTALTEEAAGADVAVSGSRVVNLRDNGKHEGARAITVHPEKLQRRYFEEEGRFSHSVLFGARSHNLKSSVAKTSGGKRKVRVCHTDKNINAGAIATMPATSPVESGQGCHSPDGDKSVPKGHAGVPHGLHSASSAECDPTQACTSRLISGGSSPSSPFHVVSDSDANSITGENTTATCDPVRGPLEFASVTRSDGAHGEQHVNVAPGFSSNRNQRISGNMPPPMPSIQRWAAASDVVVVPGMLLGPASVASNFNRTTFAESLATDDVRGLDGNCDSLSARFEPYGATPAAGHQISVTDVAAGPLSLEPSNQTVAACRKSSVPERDCSPAKEVLFRNHAMHHLSDHFIPGKVITSDIIPDTSSLYAVAAPKRDYFTSGGSLGTRHHTDEAPMQAEATSTRESRENPGKGVMKSEYSGYECEYPVDRTAAGASSSGGCSRLQLVEGITLQPLDTDPQVIPNEGVVEEAEDSIEAAETVHTRNADSSFDEQFNSSVSICEAHWLIILMLFRVSHCLECTN